MAAAVKYMDLPDRSKALSSDECWAILSAPDDGRVTSTVPIRPKAGDVYVFKVESPKNKDDYKCDHYFWQHTSQHGVPRRKPVMKRSLYEIRKNDSDSDPGFKRVVLQPTGNQVSHILVMYVGDESLAPPQNPNHGNRKYSRRPHVPQAPSLSGRILAQYHGQMPSTLYQQMEGQPISDEAVNAPRDIEKVRNVVKQAKRAGRLSHDAMHNLYELAHRLPNEFVSFMQLVPSFVCYLINRPLCQEVRDVLALPRGTLENTPLFSYDTTFQVGDFYLSVLIFRHTYFRENPVFPVAFMLHDRKYHRDHERFVSEVLSDLVDSSDRPIALVTDREFSFKTLPANVKQIYCWRHIFDNVVRAVPSSSKRSSREVAGDVMKLLRSKDRSKFDETCQQLETEWDDQFKKFFHGKLESCLVNSAARWVLEELGIYNPFSGVTTNSSESMNAKIQRLIDWRERPVDVAALFLYHLSRYYEHEIMRGKHGLGEYKPKLGYDLLPVEMMPEWTEHTIHPDQLVSFLQDPTTVQPMAADQRSDDDDTLPTEDPDQAAQEASANAKSRFAMAKAAILSRKVGCDFRTGAWVINEGEKPNAVAFGVRLDPDKCNCGASRICYHIMAARMAAGLSVNPNVGRPSVTKTFKASKLRADRSSGRKRPRKNDYEPAANAEPSTVQEGPSGDVTITDQEPLLDQSVRPGQFEKPSTSKKSTKTSKGSKSAKKPKVSLSDKLIDLPASPNFSGCSTSSESDIDDRPGTSGLGASNVASMKFASAIGKHSSIENMMTLMFIAWRHNSSVKSHLEKSTSNAAKTLQLAMNLMDARDVDGAKQTWASFLSTTTQMHSDSAGMNDSEMTNFLIHFLSVFEISGEEVCSNRQSCTKPTRLFKYFMLSVHENEPIQSQVDSIFMNISSTCTELRLVGESLETLDSPEPGGSCGGDRLVVRPTFSDPNVWFYPLGLEFYKWAPETAMIHLPDTISLLEKVFYLRGFTVRLAEDHFVSYIYANDEYFFYDGKNTSEPDENLPGEKLGIANVAIYTVS